MKRMLTTRCISIMIHQSRPALRAWLEQFQPGDLCVSAITMAELESAVLQSSDPIRNRLALILFLSQVDVLPFDAEAAKVYAQMKQKAGAQQETQDGLIPREVRNDSDSELPTVSYDGSDAAERQLLIASHAASLGAELLQTMD